mmetsp:Transcript_102566/g.318912  ORF Transcript_102566/g.318912 Transcript_102566/m.318912 type:complete len:329 (-) Transcript_102566:969-1955(-)
MTAGWWQTLPSSGLHRGPAHSSSLWTASCGRPFSPTSHPNISKSSFSTEVAVANMSLAPVFPGSAAGLIVGLPPSMPCAASALLLSMYFGVFLSDQPNWITTAVRFSSEPFWKAVRTMHFAASSGSSQCLPAQSTTSWLLRTLWMPSVASTRKESLSDNGSTFTSGSAEDSAVGCLKQRSPKERVIASPWYSRREALLEPRGFAGAAIRHAPRTFSTRPPARSMRFFSSSLSGLWSSETATAWPARQSTARESPTWASTRRSAVPSLGLPWSSATIAVEPCWSNFFRSERPRISLSVWANASLTATLIFSSRDAGCTCFCRNCARMFL